MVRIRDITTLCFLLIAGCASVTDLQTRAPSATLTSSVSVQDVAQCIRDRWQSQTFGENDGAVLQQTGAKFTVVSPPGGVPSDVAVVIPDGKLTSIAIFAQASLGINGRSGKRVAAAKTCLQ